MALVNVVGLSFRAKQIWPKVREQKADLLLWGALAVSGLISSLFAYDVGRGLTNWLIPFVFIWAYCLGRWGLTDPRGFLRSMLRGTALLAAIIIVAKLLQLDVRIGDFRVFADFKRNGRGVFLEVVSNGLAVVLEAGAVGGIGLLFASRRWQDRLETAIISALSIAAIFITMSRGAMVGVAAGIVAGGIMFSPIALVPLVAAAVAGIAFSPRLRTRIMSITDIVDNRSNVTRLRIWEGTWKLLKDRLWLGVGPGNFSRAYPFYSVPGYEHARTPHNTYLNLLTGWGIIGGLLFFGWNAWVIVRTIRRGLTPMHKVIIMILVAFWTHVLFDDLIVLYAALLLGALENEKLTEST